MPQLVSKPLNWFKTNSQVRKAFEEDDLRRLGESLKSKQLQPILAQPDGTIIAGERRYRAAKIVGLASLLASLEVKIADEPLSDSQIHIWQLMENLLRENLTGFEQWTGCYELMCMNPTWQMKDLAQTLNLDPSMVTRLLSPSKCIPAVQKALEEGTIGISDCYSISKLPEKEQAGLLALKLSGVSRDQLEQAGRKARNGSAAAVRSSKIKCQLASGVCVVVSGADLSLDEMIQALAEAGKEAKKARDQGLNCDTFQKVMRDRAKSSSAEPRRCS